jgi:NADH-quinone oxidoreductase subunit F
MTFEPVLTRCVAEPDSHTIGAYERNWGWKGLKKALAMTGPQIIEEVKASGLRGRGGAGFPTGMKWGFVPQNTGKPSYVVVNGDEGEPGTFKDKVLLENEPHMLIEGIAIAAKAVGAHQAFIYIRGEFVDGINTVNRAIAEARAAGVLGKRCLGADYAIDIEVTAGAGAYICGEETGLIESLEGKRGHPRLRPPFPAVEGAFRCPTVVNNVETLATLPHILERGAAWFSGIGSNPKNAGFKLFCVSGDVRKPGVYEAPLGIPLNELIEKHCGGWDGTPKAVIPGGVSAPVLDEKDFRIAMDFDTLAKANSMLGSGAVIVINDTRCLLRTAHRITKFFAHESCGQCSPCREGTHWLEQILRRLLDGRGREGDLDLMRDVCEGMMGTTICVLSDGCAMALLGFLDKFGDEFAAHLKDGSCRRSR